MPNGMYEGGANTVQMLLIFVGPLAGMVIAALSSGDGHLRASGGIARAAAVLFVSRGLFQAIEVVEANGVAEQGALVLILPKDLAWERQP